MRRPASAPVVAGARPNFGLGTVASDCHTDLVRSYGQYCPIARGAEIFAERWTPIIVRNILMGSASFTEIQQGAPGIPRSLLTQRLALLQRRGIIARCPNENGRGPRYAPTDVGI